MKLQTLQMMQIFFECRITVGCRLCAYPSIHVETLKITVGCRLCTGFCVVLVCIARCGVVCVLCVRGLCCVCVCGCVVCVVCVWRGLARGKLPVCRYKTHPCVPAKRPHMFNMRAFCQYTRKRFERTHGDVFNLHTVKREGVKGGRGSLHLSSFNACLSSPDSGPSQVARSLLAGPLAGVPWAALFS